MNCAEGAHDVFATDLESRQLDAARWPRAQQGTRDCRATLSGVNAIRRLHCWSGPGWAVCSHQTETGLVLGPSDCCQSFLGLFVDLSSLQPEIQDFSSAPLGV